MDDALFKYRISYFVEKQSVGVEQLDYASIINGDYQEQFISPGAKGLFFGWVDDPYWVRLDIDELKVDPQQLMMALEWPLLDDVRVMMFDQDKHMIRKYHIGSKLPFDARPVFDAHFVIPLAFDRYDIQTVLLRLETMGSMQVPLLFSTEDQFYKKQVKYSAFYSLFFGAMIIMAFYNLFVYISTRYIAYFYYVLYVSAFILHQVTLRGFGFQFFWPEYPHLNPFFSELSGALTFLFLTLFACSFLHLKREYMLNIIGQGLVVIVGVSSLTYFLLPYEMVRAPMAIVVMSTVVVLITLGCIRFRQGFRDARYYLLAWAAFFIAVVSFLLKQLGFLPGTFLIENSLLFGAVIEMLLFSLALADRLNTLSWNLNIANRKLASKNFDLEEKVRIRTQELTQAMEELTRMNEILAHTSITDKLTGLKNRHHFDSVIENEINRIKRNNSVVSLLSVDIDNFKRVNDKWGHVTGDRALQMVSACLKKEVKRNIDNVCRYGGEEFGIILPNTTLEHATDIAESIRLCVEKTEFYEKSDRIPITVSIGIASAQKGDKCNANMLVKSADIALYRAKENGRNCVHVYQGLISQIVSGH